MKLVGAQRPRVLVVPEGDEHPRWGEVVDFVRALEVELDEWQWLILRVALSRLGSVWAAFTVAVCAPRQNGKNEVLELRELIGAALLGERLVIHSAHLADTSKESFRKIGELIDAHDWLSQDVRHITRTNGFEAIEFKSGCRIRFRTRTKTGARGFRKGSPIMFDESMIFPDEAHASIFPVASAHPDPQIWYTGSAVDKETMEDGLVFARVRHDALGGGDPRLAYFEWSLGYDSPDEIPDDVADDHASVAATNPAYGKRITPAYVEAERVRLTRRARAVERLGVGDWPSVDEAVFAAIPSWPKLEDEKSRPVGDLVFAIDATPKRSYASIGVSGRRDDERFHVELVDRQPGTGWVVDRAIGLKERYRPLAFVCDGVGPAASLIPDLARAGVKVEKLNSTQHADAWGMFMDAADQDRLRHRGQPELDAAVKGAAIRPLGDRAAWARKGREDISPLVSVTLALGQLASRPAIAEPWAASW